MDLVVGPGVLSGPVHATGAPPGRGGDAADEVVARVLASRPRLGPVRLVCIDGPAGSGKTTLAEAVARGLVGRGVAAAQLHLDDLYDGWTGLEGSLWPRLAAQVLEPLRRGGPGRYQRYDWYAGAFDGWVDVPVADVLVLEGCGAARRAADPVVGLRVWVEAPPDVRLARGLERDGEAQRAHWERWMTDEAAHFARERTRQRADVRLDGFGRMAP